MPTNLAFLFSVWIKFFFLFTPFFALSMFLSMTKEYGEARRRALATQVALAVAVLCFALFFFGKTVFALFGITLDAFRVGAGALLFLSAVGLVQRGAAMPATGDGQDISVVPLAIPVVVGPATTGTLLVLGAEMPDRAHQVLGCVALALAVFCLGVILHLGAVIERALGPRGLDILTKITGLVLAALAAQMVLSGLTHFLMTGG